MIAANLSMKPGTRAFLNRHGDLFGPLALRNASFVSWVARFLEKQEDVDVTEDRADALLPSVALILREQHASGRLKEDAAAAEARASGEDPVAYLLEYAGDIEAYVVTKGIRDVPLVAFDVRDGASAAETELARATGRLLGMNAHWELRKELACWPAWRRDAVLEGSRAMCETLSRPMDAAVVIMELDALDEHGPHNLFRVLIRHHAGLGDPEGIDAEEAVKCAGARRILAGIGLIEQPGERVEVALALALPQTRETLGAIAMSLDGWLAEDPSRAKTPARFPLRVPMRAAVATDLVDMGFATKAVGGLRLTAHGMEACRVAGASDDAAKEG